MNNNNAPKAKKIRQQKTRFNHKKIDNYAWLKDKNWQKVLTDPALLSEDIKEYLIANNTYTESILEHLDQLRTAITKEMRGRIKEKDEGLTWQHGKYEYYTRTRDDGQYSLQCRRTCGDISTEEILFDGDLEAKGHDYFSVRGANHSGDHKLFSFCLDTTGSEFYTVFIKTIASNKILADKVENTGGYIVWAKGNKSFYYARLDEHHRSKWIYRHALGEDVKNDVLIYEEPDDGFFVNVSSTLSNRFIIITANNHTTTEQYIIDQDADAPILQIIEPRHTDMQYEVHHRGNLDNCPNKLGDLFYILTNCDGAINFKIMVTPVDKPTKANWLPFVDHDFSLFIKKITVFKDFMVRLESINALPQIIITEFNTNNAHKLPIGIINSKDNSRDEAFELSFFDGLEFNTNVFRYTYSSPSTPTKFCEYNVKTKHSILLKDTIIPSGHNSNDYIVKRLFARSHDYRMIPITLLYHKSTKIDGSAPCLLDGYGAYGYSMPAQFSSNVLSLVDRGVIYAIAHVRGGADKGYGWYLQGKMFNKRNTFLDFIDCAEHLINKKFVDASKIVIDGRSAGGMLVGAVTNMRPDLWAGVIAGVPFVDVLNTMCDAKLPLTPPEWSEWGNPIIDKNAYQYISSYSPYDCIKKQNYPPILAIAGLTDPRVTYWEPAKWIAKLRQFNTSKNLICLKTHMGYGHFGTTGRFARLAEDAYLYAFALKCIGLDDTTNK